MTGKPIVDEQIVQYLLGTLPEEEAERLDELSIVDDEFASRLMAVEDDLVDSYSRNEISGATLERFRSFYLSSAKGKEKTRFAKTLLLREQRSATPQAAPAKLQQVARPTEGLSFLRNLREFFMVPRLTLQWGLAAAAFVLAAASGFLFLGERHTRDRLEQTQAERAALELREKEERQANASALEELRRLRETVSQLEPRRPTSELSIASFILPPPMRSASRLPVLTVPKGTDEVVLHLQLEADDFARYGAALKDPATSQIVWRSTRLMATSGGGGKAVAVALPVLSLKPQNYTLELSGLGKQSGAESIASYGFGIALE